MDSYLKESSTLSSSENSATAPFPSNNGVSKKQWRGVTRYSNVITFLDYYWNINTKRVEQLVMSWNFHFLYNQVPSMYLSSDLSITLRFLQLG